MYVTFGASGADEYSNDYLVFEKLGTRSPVKKTQQVFEMEKRTT
jgi:hypothetical protein